VIPLRDLSQCEGADDPASGSPVSLLRVMLFNLVCALDQGHVAPASVRTVVIDLLTSSILLSSAVADVHVDQLYLELASILTRHAPALFFEREHEIISFTDANPFTYQPTWAFQFWIDMAEARKPIHSAADVAVLIDAFDMRRKAFAGVVLGAPRTVVWFTPSIGTVHNTLEAAWQYQRTKAHGMIDSAWYADQLRALLGLQRRAFPERAVALILDEPIGHLYDWAKVQAARSASRRPLAAPTQFDARDYPRFRHWPSGSGAVDQDYGRTWSLDGGSTAPSVRGGVPEIVAEPLGLDRVRRIVSLGLIRTETLSDDDAIKADRAFADKICGSESLAELLEKLGKMLAL